MLAKLYCWNRMLYMECKKMFGGLLLRAVSRFAVFRAAAKFPAASVYFFRAAAKFLVVNSCFFGLLQSLSLTVAIFLPCGSALSFGLLQSLCCVCGRYLSGCCKVSRCVRVPLSHGLLQSFSSYVCAFSRAAQCKLFVYAFSRAVAIFLVYRCVGVLLIGLLQSVFLGYCKVPCCVCVLL